MPRVTDIKFSYISEFGTVLAALSLCYALLAYVAVRMHGAKSRCTRAASAPATVLKPLCGAEPETYACLKSFCEQMYPEYQVVFGVSDPADPAIAIVRRLQAELAHRDIQLVVDRRVHGSNRKVSNLINMMSTARYDLLVLADSDVSVDSDYLGRVVAPLADPSVGIVTCGYRGIPRAGLWSVLGASFINEWFMPSVCVSSLIGSRSFAFGATIALRRDTLARIGGFDAIADQLADDYRLGELTRSLGLRTVLSDVVVDLCVVEPGCAALLQHELRWLRTIRMLRPWGYAFSFVTFSVPVAALGTLLAHGTDHTVALLVMTALARLMLHWESRRRGAWVKELLALPLRDCLTLGLWCWSFVTRRVRWRDGHYQVTRDGSIQTI